jgi:hypothetical protein
MSRTLEQGDVFFFYRPRVGADDVRRLDHVQRFFFVHEPQQRALFRRLIVVRKRLPDVRAHERVWAFVAEVAEDPEALREELERAAYETRTRGTHSSAQHSRGVAGRQRSDARALGRRLNPAQA